MQKTTYRLEYLDEQGNSHVDAIELSGVDESFAKGIASARAGIYNNSPKSKIISVTKVLKITETDEYKQYRFFADHMREGNIEDTPRNNKVFKELEDAYLAKRKQGESAHTDSGDILIYAI